MECASEYTFDYRITPRSVGDKVPGHAITGIEFKLCHSRQIARDDCQTSRFMMLPQHPPGASVAELAAADALMQLPLADFLATKVSRPAPYDWTSELDDGEATACSAPDGVNVVFGPMFSPACERHDFGYRNYGKRWMDPTDWRRLQVDERFLHDMRGICDREFAASGGLRASCRTQATSFYQAVKNFGGPAFYGEG
jgi:hypothetical protein